MVDLRDELRVIRNFIDQRYKEFGIEKIDIKLDPKTLVDDLKMSTRLKRILKKNYVLNVQDVSELRTFEMIRFEGMGGKTIIEFDRFRYQYQLGKPYID